MFLIIYKMGTNADKSKIEFDKPLTFVNANEMLIEAVDRYRQTGQIMKVSYKIIEIETGEGIFNSRIIIDSDITSLYQLIKDNSSAPKIVIDYVMKVKNREIIEEETTTVNSHLEEKEMLELLKAEKNDISIQLKKDEKERLKRELEYENRMRELQNEKEAIEKSIQKKEEEEAAKELQRLEAIRLLEEKKNKASQLMAEKRILDKQKNEEHELRLKQIEEEAKKAEIELAKIEVEVKKNELERKKELQELEAMKMEADQKASILKAEDDKEKVKYQHEKITVEALQKDDFEEVTSDPAQNIKDSTEGHLDRSNMSDTSLDNNDSKRAIQDIEKDRKKVTFDFAQNEVIRTAYQAIPSKIIVVGSLYRGAGSTILATNFARMISERGIDVSYVEHPLIKPYMFEYLQIHTNEEKEYFDISREIHSESFVRSKRQEWVQHKVKWYVIDPRKPLLSSFSYDNMLVLSRVIQSSVLIVDISNRWLDPEIQKFLYLADHIYLCLESDPIKYDWSLFQHESNQIKEKKIMDFLNGDEKLPEYDLLNMKYIKGLNTKSWSEMLQKKPLAKIPYIPYEDIQQAVFKSKLLYDLGDYKDILEEILSPLLKVLPRDLRYIENKEGNIFKKVLRNTITSNVLYERFLLNKK